MIMLHKMANRNYTFYPLATAGFLIAFATSSYSQIPKLNSNKGAAATVLLDFDGHTVEGTAWNWEAETIKAKPAALATSAIEDIFRRVAEDFTIFNLNITTDPAVYSNAPATKRVRVIITPTSSWYPEAPGVSFVNSFTWGDGTPSWVFNDRLYNNNKYLGEAISHEIGHTLGLQHQSTYDRNCNKILEYAEGKGEGETGWAPIMGISYYKNITTWHTGPNSLGCHEIQNDIDIITNGVSKIPLRKDDHGSTRADATLITGLGKFEAAGMVNDANDKDAFRLVLITSSVLRANVIPKNVGANIDIKLNLVKSNGDTIGTYNPKNSLSASIDTSLSAGTYYLVIDGVANENLPEQGSVGYYDLAGSVQTILPIIKLSIRGLLQRSLHAINWSFEADEPVKFAVIESSVNGVEFAPLKSFEPSVTQYSYTPNRPGTIFYRMKVVTVRSEESYYSNVISMECHMDGDISIVSNMVSTNAQVAVNGNYAYQLMDETGRLLQRGKLTAGMNNVAMGTQKTGLLLLRVFNEKEQKVFRLIKQ